MKTRLPRLRYSLIKKVYYLNFEGKTYMAEHVELFPKPVLNKIREKYVLTEKTMEKAQSKARGDLRKKHAGIKQGLKGWTVPGYKLERKTVNYFKRKHSGISTESYERAVHNLKWCEKMKHMGYNALPDYLECQETIAKYNGTVFDRNLIIEQYKTL